MMEIVVIENEQKFVITNNLDLEERLSQKYGWHDIRQGYLNPNNRIREITYQSGFVDYIFSFKQRLTNGRNIEIESDEITKENFDDLWKFTSERLFKRRISAFVDNLRWDIDFPRWESNTRYFAMAEVEMPADMETPPFILPDIEPHIVHVVPRSDNRFSARKLSDEDFAKNLFRLIGGRLSEVIAF